MNYLFVSHFRETLCPKCGALMAKARTPNFPSLSRVVNRDGTDFVYRGGIEPTPSHYEIRCACGWTKTLVSLEDVEVMLESAPAPSSVPSVVTALVS